MQSMIVLIPLLVAITGLVIYAISTNPKIQEIGRIAYACGLLVTVFVVAGQSVRILPS